MAIFSNLLNTAEPMSGTESPILDDSEPLLGEIDVLSVDIYVHQEIGGGKMGRVNFSENRPRRWKGDVHFRSYDRLVLSFR